MAPHLGDWRPAEHFGNCSLKDGVLRSRETPTAGEGKWSNFENTSAFCFSVTIFDPNSSHLKFSHTHRPISDKSAPDLSESGPSSSGLKRR